MHILITIFPRAEHRSLARLGRPTCPFRPASRNLINLPVASSLAPCRRSEILYPSHPLKPTSERFVPSLLAHFSCPQPRRTRARVLATQREHPLIVRISLNFISGYRHGKLASGIRDLASPSNWISAKHFVFFYYCFDFFVIYFFCDFFN